MNFAETVPVVFGVDELWYLRSVVRHEMADQEKWTSPPVSDTLNDQICEALVVLDTYGETECALELTRRHCLLLDYVVEQDAKDARGVMLGKAILLKAARARMALSGTSLEPVRPVNVERVARLDTWRKATEE